MAKNLISGLILTHLIQIWAPKKFFVGFTSTRSWIVASYNYMQFQGKLMIQTQENGKKPHFCPDLGPLGPIKFLFQKSGFVSH